MEINFPRRFCDMKRWTRFVILAVLVLVLAFIGISGYIGYSMTRQERLPLAGNPADIGLAFENISFPGIDEKLTLRGWLLPAEDSAPAIIMVHGNGANRNDPTIGTMEIAAGLVGRGYNVLMFDLRGCGESDGKMVSGGYHEKKDLLGAVNYLKNRGFEKVGVIGFSLGAVTSLLAAAETGDIHAVVSDSSYADLADIMEPEFSKRTSAPRFLLKPILFMIKVMFGVDFTAIRPVDCVAQIASGPVFFIHGENDETIPYKHAERLYRISDNPLNRLWIVPGTDHVGAYKTHPVEYIEKVADFFDSGLR